MSTPSKICFVVAFVLLVISAATLFMVGQWINLIYVLLGLAALLVVGAILIDVKLYWDFFTMRTTKHGMNMGMLILLAVTFMVCVNYLANKHNKTWDLTT